MKARETTQYGGQAEYKRAKGKSVKAGSVAGVDRMIPKKANEIAPSRAMLSSHEQMNEKNDAGGQKIAGPGQFLSTGLTANLKGEFEDHWGTSEMPKNAKATGPVDVGSAYTTLADGIKSGCTEF
jgi:hypothetical protein